MSTKRLFVYMKYCILSFLRVTAAFHSSYSIAHGTQDVYFIMQQIFAEHLLCTRRFVGFGTRVVDEIKFPALMEIRVQLGKRLNERTQNTMSSMLDSDKC